MADADSAKLRHLIARGTSRPEPFTSPHRGPSEFEIPLRDRLAHGRRLLDQISVADQAGQNSKAEARAVGLPDPSGILVSFRSEPETALALQSLESERSGVRLLSVRQEGNSTVASVFVPDGKLGYFRDRIEAYLTKESKNQKPQNEKLVASISEIAKTVARNLWTDDEALFPASDESVWWEIWLRTSRGGTEESVFRESATSLGLRVSARSISFVDRRVLLAYGSRGQIERSIDLLDMIAELRRAKDSPSDFTEMSALDQKERLQDLLNRLSAPSSQDPAVCILDTGVNHKHPLLQPAIFDSDVQASDPRWSPADHQGHGTEMAGLALYGDLRPVLSSREPVILRHRLESVKLLPPSGYTDPELYGAITAEALARAEVAAPLRARAICIAVSSIENRDRGLPSSWSSELDALASGANDDQRRLIFVAAGNVARAKWLEYPNSNHLDLIHDPAQAWNALTVGAFTDMSQLDAKTKPDWSLLARPGSLSPSSTTSMTWESRWPLKPDLVLEGGNAAVDPGRSIADAPDDLSLLTTYWQFSSKLLVTTGDTSAATAQAARMGALLLADYPNLWPETIRALLVHSARWTQPMLDEFPVEAGLQQRLNLLRCYGHGVPDVTRALWSLRNDVTLVVQDELQPFQKGKAGIESGQMNLHQLPWPVDVLRELGPQSVRMRVVLSYFIEPNPARRGESVRHRYHSHGLRFAVKHATEPLEYFRKRINLAARGDEDPSAPPAPRDTGWTLGSKAREHGSVHADIWEGAAADLGERGVIAVYPVGGWWKERPTLGRWGRSARYALIVSIAAPEIDIDLYTAVETRIPTEILVPSR